jgi:putative ABC transport system substrate-binding protein
VTPSSDEAGAFIPDNLSIRHQGFDLTGKETVSFCMDRRRAVVAIVGLGLGLSASRASGAQARAKGLVLGLLDAGERPEWWVAFAQELRSLGYAEGQNVAFEKRFALGRFEQLPRLAQELVALEVAVIVTAGTAAAEAAKRATRAIPIVTATGSLEETASLARPGANVTGVTSLSAGLTGKRVELAQEIVPKLSRLAVLWHQQGSTLALKEVETATRSPKVPLQVLGVRTADGFTGAFSAMTRERAQAVFVIADPMFFHERQRIAHLALKHRLPSIHGQSEFAEVGGLVSYGPSYPDLFRHAAIYVDKIIKGAKPADLPIEQPTKFALVINMKTARVLGLKMPSSVLLRADRVIE